MAVFNPYLNFPGNTEEAFRFYKSIFGGEFTSLQRFKETPEANRVSDAEKNKIMHVSLPVGKGNVLMGTDALESMGHKLTPGNNYYIAIEADTKEQATQFFDHLAEGGKKEMPLGDAFWGAYFGMVSDKFGTHWMINYTYPKDN